MKGCGHKFIYHHDEEGVIVLKCGEWKQINKIDNHIILKYCYDCLDKFYESYLKESEVKG